MNTLNFNDYSLIDEVRKRLVQTRNGPKPYTPKKGIKPSSLGSPCLRKNYYVYHRLESNFPIQIHEIEEMKAGDAYHWMIRQELSETGFLIENLDSKTGEVPKSIDGKSLDPEFVVSDPDLGIRYAKVDGIIEVSEGPRAGLWALEIKSKKPEKMKFVAGPDRDEFQGNLYAFLLEKALSEGKFDHIPRLSGKTEIKGCVYVYVARGGSQRREFWREKNPVHMASIIDRCTSILSYVEQKRLPPKTKDFCDWCPFRDRCANEYLVEV